MTGTPELPAGTALAPKHADTLRSSAISAEAATEWGVRSVLREEDLPAELHGTFLSQGVPGILFPLRRHDGTIVYQLRCDDPVLFPDGNERKYLQQEGTGSVINIPALTAGRAASAKRILIVEGTKQTIAAALYADEDTFIIGVQGSSNWSSEGVIVNDLVTMIRSVQNADTVEICFDADVQKNPNVYDAAKKLEKAVSATAGKKVVYVRLTDAGVGAKAGLDDYLGSQDESLRAQLLERLRKVASPKIGRRPVVTKKLSSSPISMRFDEGRIVAATDDEGTGERTLLNAAAVIDKIIDRTVITKSGEKIAREFEMRVALRQPDGSVRNTDITINEKELKEVDDWLGKVPGQWSAHIKRPTSARDNLDIANTIRENSDEASFVRIVPTLGWHEYHSNDFELDSDDVETGNEWVYLTPGGAVRAGGRLATTLSGEAPLLRGMTWRDPASLNADEKREAIREFFTVRDLIAEDQTILWDTLIAAFGACFLPRIPKVALGYFGYASSGKTTVVQTLMSALSQSLAPDVGAPMLTFNATVAATDLAATGMQNILLHVDDLKPATTRNERDRQAEVLDALLRRSHGAGGKARGTIDANESLSLQTQDASTPLVIITGERVPTDLVPDSALDRWFLLHMEPNKTFRDVNGDGGSVALSETRRRAKSGDFEYVTRMYVGWLAEMINRGSDMHPRGIQGAMDDYRAVLDARLERVIAELSADARVRSARLSNRAEESLASLIIGAESFGVFMRAFRVWDAQDHHDWLNQLRENLILQSASNASTVMGDYESDGAKLLTRVKAQVAQGAMILLDEVSTGQVDIPPGKILLGKYLPAGESGEGACVFVNRAIVASRFKNGDTRGVTAELGTLAVQDEKGAVRQLRMNGQKVRGFAIPMEVWDAA